LTRFGKGMGGTEARGRAHFQPPIAPVGTLGAHHPETRQEPPRITPDVTRVTLHGGACPCCHGRFKAPPPAGLEPGSPFGPNLRALALHLRFGQAIPFARLARLLSDLFGLSVSEGALAGMLADSAPAFAVQASDIRRRLLSGTVLQSDETSVRVGDRTFRAWVFHHGDSACFAIRPSRGKAVVAAFLGDVRPACWVSDRLAAQMGWAAEEHQVAPGSTRSASPTCCATSGTRSRPATTPRPPGSWPC
jgi:transposase